MNEGGFKSGKGEPRRSGDGGARGNEKQELAPGKLTRTSRLGPPPQTAPRAAPSRPPPASMQPVADPMDDAELRGRAELSARWMDTAIRPDLYPPPKAANVAAPVQHKSDPAAARARAADDEPGTSWLDAAFAPHIVGPPVQCKGAGEPHAPAAPAPARGEGRAMPEDVQAKMEHALDADFSAVHIHEGPEAATMGALAYTQGTDIHFAPGQYDPGSQQGQELLGHELAHVVQQAEGRVPAATQAKGAAGALVHDDPALEREADLMGARAARGQRAAGAASTRMDRAGQAMTPMHTSASPAVQAKPADEKPLWENAEKDAAALFEAFQGLGTTEQVVYRVLNQPPELVDAVLGVYNSRYNRHTGQGLVEDLRAEFDHMGSQADWHFVLGQLTRAGIAVPDAALRYERHDPAAVHQGGAHIVATPDVRVAVPGTRITYALAHGTQGLHSLSSPYRYQWYVLNDPVTARMYGRPARVEGEDGPQAEATARFVGNHKVICKVVHRSGRGAGVPTFYEFPQTVVPEGKLAQDALKHAPAALDPARQLAVLERFLEVLRDAERQPGSVPLAPQTAMAYEEQIAALRKRLASTEGAERIPIQAVHVDREKARVSPLRAFVARTKGGEPGDQETWRLVDLTNPESRRLSGEYEGTGKDARAAIFAALAAWNEGNRYPTGRIQLEVGPEAAGTPIAHTFQTDGMSFWDSISEFFAEVGFWTGMGALAAGVVTAVTPVPGMRIVSGLVWASILASSASAVINISQRHAEGMSSTREDAMDVLTIAGNILAGTWMRGARVLVHGRGGTKIGTGLLIGQLGTDTAQGIVLGIEYLEQYDRVMAIEDPKQRTDALMELLRSAALAGGMLFFSVQGTRSDLGRLGQSRAQGGEGYRLDSPASSEMSRSAGRTDAHAERVSEPASPHHESEVPRAGQGPQPREPGLPRDGRLRTPQEHMALAAELPPELRGRIDIVESDAIPGAGVHVAYKNGALRIEVGPDATPRHVRYHVGTARHLLKYQGPLGQIRRLVDAILTKLRLTPGYGTRGFEARQEVKKLLEIQSELETLRARLDGRVRALEGRDDLAQLDARQIDRELAEIQEQLEYHQEFIDSYEPGRGFVAAGSKGGALTEFPVAKSALYEQERVTSKEWALSYHVKAHDGTEIYWGDVYVALDEAGNPISYPSFVLEARVHRDGVEHAMHIYDDVVDASVEPPGHATRRVGAGSRTPATHHAIERMLEAYKKRFGHLPEAIEGSLADKNKLNFQREYVRACKEQGLPEEEAKLAAIRRISFGRHRMAFGYDDFKVKLGEKKVLVDLGPPFGVQAVPDRISVVARQFQIP